MRLHRLSLTAFGPFPGAEVVDLDEVARDGLFLLWGPTGSGKTTLLDAVVYALYGTVPGARGEEKRLRSDHAEPATRTEVTCELTLGGERLLVTRRPEQLRPKKRGTGTTAEPARLLVQRLGPEGWEAVSTRIDEGAEYLRTRLGLDVHQFCQVVLLPQGDFARFLRAEPDHRAELLRTLFDVERFARVEDWLAGERRAAEEALRGERLRLSTLLARVAQTADADVPEELAPELVGADPGGPVDAWVTRLRRRAAADLTEAGAAATTAAAAATASGEALAVARLLADRHARRDRAREELARLDAAEPSLVPVRTRLDAGRRAEALRETLESAGRAALEAERTAAELTAARRAWKATGEEREPALDLARRLRDDAAEARALLPEAERATDLARRVTRSAAEEARLADRCAAADQALAALPEAIAAAQALVDTATAAAGALPARTGEAGAARAALAAGRDAEGLAVRLARARAGAGAAREAWLTAREELVDLRTRRLDGMAAELAGGLLDGVDCPVCGALEHPRPAVPAGPPVSADDEDRARERADAAEIAAGTAATAAEDMDRELAVLRARAGGRPLVDLEAAAVAADLALAEVAATAAGLPGSRSRLAALTEERDDLGARLVADREELGSCSARRAAGAAELAALTARVDAVRGEDRDLERRARRLTTAAERCEAALDAEAAERRARVGADTARRAAGERAVAAGFADVAEAAGALLERTELATLEERVTAHERARDAVQHALADPELAQLAPAPDLAAAEAHCADTTAAREETVAARDRARRRSADLDALAGDVVAAEVRLHERRNAAAQVAGLADLVNGRGANTLRMRLQSFVLAARLEQVAEVASRRLLEMSGSRYTFRHSDAQGRHGARGGLGLEVFDEYTGTLRPTKTLSGGESFMASLALALGLADVVTAESGGVQIDTLFVDEGFGTLDAGALDAVMDVLDDLRRGGRTVGVISHVEELRTRIPTKLEVLAGRSGSRLAG
ncbi:AAA family ATPase [Trujillonella endophytica]|uniref:Nuclease SbcCD subunit C n=1 Tax=Trujillonella endophytica TaxID=673521 RepID=A0A1H8RU53_9ACTN|nr:SMC family ATPase [Trujillella endophytica]SEO70001.1 exonuclease SbcC [Trujillella endophytica]